MADTNTGSSNRVYTARLVDFAPSGIWRRVDVGPHHADLVILLVQIVEQNIAQRNHAYELALMANGQVSKAVATHQSHAGFKVLSGSDG